ncbi:hypothetical protein HY495_04155 [Candidatus Woesearchaeota archaeon]|nr:hypothetical protein [Candidatus Woesearchaeota archaeon]
MEKNKSKSPFFKKVMEIEELNTLERMTYLAILTASSGDDFSHNMKREIMAYFSERQGQPFLVDIQDGWQRPQRNCFDYGGFLPDKRTMQLGVIADNDFQIDRRWKKVHFPTAGYAELSYRTAMMRDDLEQGFKTYQSRITLLWKDVPDIPGSPHSSCDQSATMRLGWPKRQLYLLTGEAVTEHLGKSFEKEFHEKAMEALRPKMCD